jgi:protocatechuate 3,4-dioxygenase beta subunit
MTHSDHDHAAHDHGPDGGLALDLPGLLGRRRVLRLLGIGGAVVLVGCGSHDSASPSATTSRRPSAGGTGADVECPTIVEETAGPFPGDGSNGPNVLADSGAVRRDITSSFGSASGFADGVPLRVEFVVVDASAGCAPMAGTAVYAWQCDREGRYSLYSDGVTEENYLRGVQQADGAGRVTFDSIFPGAYPGRWPHIHFEVYRDLASATASEAPIATSQIALPPEACAVAYAAPGYEASLRAWEGTSIGRDGVFAEDGGVTQLATWSGDASVGIAVELDVSA